MCISIWVRTEQRPIYANQLKFILQKRKVKMKFSSERLLFIYLFICSLLQKALFIKENRLRSLENLSYSTQIIVKSNVCFIHAYSFDTFCQFLEEKFLLLKSFHNLYSFFCFYQENEEKKKGIKGKGYFIISEHARLQS